MTAVEIPLTQGYVALVDEEDTERVEAVQVVRVSQWQQGLRCPQAGAVLAPLRPVGGITPCTEINTGYNQAGD